MTKYEAGCIEVLASNTDMNALIEIEERDYEQECRAQLGRNFRTPHEEFMYHQGMIQGMNLMRFKTHLEEAKKVLAGKEEDERCIVTTTAR